MQIEAEQMKSRKINYTKIFKSLFELNFDTFSSAISLLVLLIFDRREFLKAPPTRRTVKASSARNAAGVPAKPKLKNRVWQCVPVNPSGHLQEGTES